MQHVHLVVWNNLDSFFITRKSEQIQQRLAAGRNAYNYIL